MDTDVELSLSAHSGTTAHTKPIIHPSSSHDEQRALKTTLTYDHDSLMH